MSKRKLKDPCRYDTDVIARKLWLSLVGDFRAFEGDSFCSDAESALLSGIKSFREYDYPELGLMTASRFKRYKQVECLLKKYRFATDAFSDQELEEITLTNYFGEQERLALYRPMSFIGHQVLQRARFHARQVLGRFDPEEVINCCRFGKKSSIGCSLSLAYIDEKLSSVKAFTGSSQCAFWFKKAVLPDDHLLSEIVAEMSINWTDPRLAHESLNLVQVPKSWKTFRTITPLTLLSLFYSNGIGELVTVRLQKAKLNIGTLQERHRRLVKQFSMSLTHATADLSAASDSLTSELLNRVLPREWYCALKPILTRQVCYEADGRAKMAYTESVLPMGNGATFPVETLMFYCIIRAIGDLAKVDGLFSVYGDDLIYPSKLHKYVVGLFPHFKLKLNLDKTFVKYPFRESCGADFYRGCDVRPFFLQGEHCNLTRSQYQAFLYKTYNGLVRRWDPLEISRTLYLLIKEILLTSDKILRVPPEYPDTAGIKTLSPWEQPIGLGPEYFEPIYVSLDGNGNKVFGFKYLKETAKFRYVKTLKPYYWLSLQGRDDELDDVDYGVQTRPKPFSGIPCEAKRQAIQWRKRRFKREYTKGGKRVVRTFVRYSACVASRVELQYQTRVGLTSEWV